MNDLEVFAVIIVVCLSILGLASYLGFVWKNKRLW
jgi:hypothetical protein